MAVPVTVIVCTHNRADALRHTLASVGALDVPADLEPDLVVVDNNAGPETEALLASVAPPNMPLRVVREARPGAGPARNAGLRAARGDVILFTDDDVRLPPDWLEAMCRPILTGATDAVAGCVRLAPHLDRPWMGSLHRVPLASTEGMDRERPQEMFGASMAFARCVLDRVPGFDPELGPGTAVGGLEDTLFAWQLREAGYRIAFVPRAVEHHPDPSRLTRASYLAAAERFGQSRAYIAYHWEHKPYARIGYVPTLLLTVAYRRVRLLWWRATRRRDCRRTEGVARWEFMAVRGLAANRQSLRERSRPRNYERRGLTKRTDPPRTRSEGEGPPSALG